jgi:hypothetical protein
MDFGQRILTTRHFSGLHTTANQGEGQGECGLAYLYMFLSQDAGLIYSIGFTALEILSPL